MPTGEERQGMIVGAGALVVIVGIGLWLQQACQTAVRQRDLGELADTGRVAMPAWEGGGPQVLR